MSDHYKVFILRGDEELANGEGEDTGFHWDDLALTDKRQSIISGYCIQEGGRYWDGKLYHKRTERGDNIHYAELHPSWVATGWQFADDRAGRCRLAFVPVFEEAGS